MKKLLITNTLKPITEAGKAILSRRNIGIYTASSAEEILSIHKQENVDLILTDLDMTGASDEGICSVINDIREDNALKKVSIITVCDNDKSAIEKSYACGANTFITKPVDSVKLFNKIINFLNISERANLRVILNVAVKGEFEDTFFFANSENISNTGLLFTTDESLEKDDIIKCSFFVGHRLITANGKVTRVGKEASDQNFYGLQFVELDDISREQIEKFIEETA